ncbi:MAG: MFS transporter, partial [Gammaproteobacteria bacterium]|nr:MFS transporter [Gammaproteobacteria bacterium]
DVFDAMLFNFVASNCIPTLLGLTLGSTAAREATVYWTGILSAVLLVGWAAGGVIFGWVADRYGRRVGLMLTILVYALGTTLCAFATSIEQLALFRALTSLGIGGEWAVGAALVAESVPEQHRVEAGALLQTASPLGIMLASLVNYQIAGVWLADDPANSWRYVFLCGLARCSAAERQPEQGGDAVRGDEVEEHCIENIAACRSTPNCALPCCSWWVLACTAYSVHSCFICPSCFRRDCAA